MNFQIDNIAEAETICVLDNEGNEIFTKLLTPLF